MSKVKVLLVAALMLTVLGGVTAVNHLKPVVAHAQTTTTQAQQSVTSAKTDSEVVDTKENVNTQESAQEKNIPGGGHQDVGGSVDHQFEGVE